MIALENTKVFNIDGALRGMRNPLESFSKADSGYDEQGNFYIGVNDLTLARKLILSGTDHRKFLRQIMVCVDITAPLYWWKEFDTYKVGTVANSTSTMHTIHKKPFTFPMFSFEKIIDDGDLEFLTSLVRQLNSYRTQYLRTKDKNTWYKMIQLLPSSFNQTRTVTMNFENLLNMYHSRKNHKLDEWRQFCYWIEYNVPYFNQLCL
jgi:hypothetical protein